MPANRPPPLRIAILGPGRIGSALGFQLATKGKHEVTVVARIGSARLRQLQRDRGIVNLKGERADVRIAETLDEQSPYDLVIVTLLAHQVGALLPALRRCAAKDILFMFNTFEPEALGEAVGVDRCAWGMPFLQADFDGEGRLRATISPAGPKSILSRQRWVEVFKAAGVPAAFEGEMPLWLRCHAPLCIAFQSVSVAGVLRGGGCSWDEARVVGRGVREAFALIRALGYRIYPTSKARISLLPPWLIAALLWGLSRNRSFRTLLASGRNEARALIDAMIRAAPMATGAARLARVEAMRPA